MYDGGAEDAFTETLCAYSSWFVPPGTNGL